MALHQHHGSSTAKLTAAPRKGKSMAAWKPRGEGERLRVLLQAKVYFASSGRGSSAHNWGFTGDNKEKKKDARDAKGKRVRERMLVAIFVPRGLSNSRTTCKQCRQTGQCESSRRDAGKARALRGGEHYQSGYEFYRRKEENQTDPQQRKDLPLQKEEGCAFQEAKIFFRIYILGFAWGGPGSSIGRVGGTRGNRHLRKSQVFLRPPRRGTCLGRALHGKQPTLVLLLGRKDWSRGRQRPGWDASGIAFYNSRIKKTVY